MRLTIASTFSGVGGIDLAFERAGCRTALLCEKDKHAAAVLRHHWPDTPIHDDITELTADDLHAAGCRPESTVLIGGFPCQDLSVAGARRGMGAGTRSGLYWHLDRLMAEFRPAWVVFENVPGLLSSQDGRDMGAVVGSLAERGYGWAYRVLDAQHFGVPQRRRRVVIVGRLGDSGATPARVLLEPEGGDRDSAEGGPSGAIAAASPARGVSEVVGSLQAHHGRLDADSAGGGHLVRMTFWKVIRSGARDADGNLPPEVWAERDIAATLNLNDLGSETRAVELVVTQLAVRGRDGGAQIEVGPDGGPPYNALRAGDGGSSRQSLVAITTLGDRTHALTAEGHYASEDGTGRGTPIIATHTEVRRLTPLETERLQGHPDNWTKVAARPDGTTYEQSDSQRYKQMGNGVAVPVFEWVARRVVAEHQRLTQAGAA